MARRKLTDAGVENLKPRAARYAHPDPELARHYVRVTPQGAKSFCAVARDPSGKQVWVTLGKPGLITIDESRERAREAIKRVRQGLPAFEQATKAETFAAVSEQWMRRHVEAKGLRTKGEIARILRKYVVPSLGELVFTDIRRSDVVNLLDTVEDENGARQADTVFTVVSSIMHWFAGRNDDYAVPLVKGMKRSDPKKGKRSRILDDAELRAVWKQAEANGTFGAFVRLALLTAQRKERLATMRWADLVDGQWVIPARDRAKGTGEALVLPKMALAIIGAQPCFESNPFVLAGRGAGHFNHFSQAKAAFDAKLPDIKPWVVHDLRRTSRSLMSRAGVRSETAERVLGHVLQGVEGIYDRHSYRDEKADALERLAALIETIINPAQGNIVPLARAK